MAGQPTPPRKTTIYDVARHAGLSIASVSRVLNGRDDPRPETRDRVLRAVAELGFVPDGAARGAAAFDSLLALINGDTGRDTEVVLPTALVIRSSCGCRADTSVLWGPRGTDMPG